jgi:thiol-disulfide isomerase/thioredoxin
LTLAALDDAPVWLNSPPLTAAELRWRVVLVDFWTYSCVNWLRTLPYVRAWADRYRDDGLVVVGAHAPEFQFEHDLENVRRAVAELDVTHPVVIDNDFAIWRSFDNHYWPAVYLVGRDGQITFRHFGEEAYAETERAIQDALGVEGERVRVDAGGLSLAADWEALASPETYLGYARGARNGGRLAGAWAVNDEFVELEEPGGTIGYRFRARDVNLVLAPGAQPARFAVRVDGEPPGDDHGLDTNAAGEGVVTEPRMHQLVRQRSGFGDRTFEVTFLDAGVRAYVFTFG